MHKTHGIFYNFYGSRQECCTRNMRRLVKDGPLSGTQFELSRADDMNVFVELK